MKKQLNHIGVGVDDVSDILEQIEEKLNIRFKKNELANVKTFGTLCDIILSKIDLEEKKDCTSQQAFYKLKNSILENIAVDKTSIKPDTTLKELFAISVQINKIRNIENSLGFRLDILKIKRSAILITLIGFVLSIFAMFINLLYGFFFASFFLILHILKIQKIKEFKVSTIREVVEIMKQNNYFKARRNENTVNKKEVIKLIEKYFIENLATDLKELNRDTVIA